MARGIRVNPPPKALALAVVARAPDGQKSHFAAELGACFDDTGIGPACCAVEGNARPQANLGRERSQNVRYDVDRWPPVRLEHDAAHAHRLSLGQPKKLWLALALLGGEFKVDVAVDVDHAFHHVVVQSHGLLLQGSEINRKERKKRSQNISRKDAKAQKKRRGDRQSPVISVVLSTSASGAAAALVFLAAAARAGIIAASLTNRCLGVRG